jgi:hypothetical protein
MVPVVVPAHPAAESGSPSRTPGSSRASSPVSASAAPLGTPAYGTHVGAVRPAGQDETNGGRSNRVFSGERASAIIIAMPRGLAEHQIRQGGLILESTGWKLLDSAEV